MGEEDSIKYCLGKAEALASGKHYDAALIYLIQAAEILAKEFLGRRGVRVLYFSACIPHLIDANIITEDEVQALRRINTLRNLVIHSGLSISEEEYEGVRKNIFKLIEKLK